MNSIQCVMRGSGTPLLLVHGLGGNPRSWGPIAERLAAERAVIAVQLPGCGSAPALPGPMSPTTLSDALATFIRAQGLGGVEIVGHSLGGLIALELARRGGLVGRTIALAPGGFWRGWHRHAAFVSLSLSVRIVRLLRESLPLLSGHAPTRSLLVSMISRRGPALSPSLVAEELLSHARSSAFDELAWRGIYGEVQQGAPEGSIPHPVVIGWGRQDRVCYPGQARVARRLFPDARIHWFGDCGHYVHWDQPAQAASLILHGSAPAVSVEGPGLAPGRAAASPPREDLAGQLAV